MLAGPERQFGPKRGSPTWPLGKRILLDTKGYSMDRVTGIEPAWLVRKSGCESWWTRRLGPLRYVLAPHQLKHIAATNEPCCHFGREPGEGDGRIPFVRADGPWVEALAERKQDPRSTRSRGWAQALRLFRSTGSERLVLGLKS